MTADRNVRPTFETCDRESRTMRHVFARELAELADRIEQQFFRVEKEKRFLSSLINGLIAGASVAAVAWLMGAIEGIEGRDERNLLLFGCLGSSAAAIVCSPLSRNNSLRSIGISYCSSAIVCAVLYPIHHYAWLPLAGECFLAVMLTTSLVRLAGTLHPAAVGAALAFILYERNVHSLLLLLLAIIGLLTIVKVLVYIYRKELTFRNFHREFRREFYGHEMMLTVTDGKPSDVAEEKEHEDAAR